MSVYEMPEYRSSGQCPGFTLSRIESVSGARIKRDWRFYSSGSLTSRMTIPLIEFGVELDQLNARRCCETWCVERNLAPRSHCASHQELMLCPTPSLTTMMTITTIMTITTAHVFCWDMRMTYLANYHRSNPYAKAHPGKDWRFDRLDPPIVSRWGKEKPTREIHERDGRSPCTEILANFRKGRSTHSKPVTASDFF